MALIFRWLMRLLTLAVLLVAGAVAVVYYLAAGSLPDYAAEHDARGLQHRLEIVRDNANVPHIFGQSDEDTYFGLGYVHAQDRLWQMMLMRRTAQGRLSELFGTRTLKTDELMRRLDVYNLARQSVAVQDDYAKVALAAYARGVNARIERINTASLGRGAPEFFLFPPDIAPWTPTDSLAVAKVMGVQLSGHIQREVRRARAALVLPPDRLADLLPEAPGQGIAALPDYAALFDSPVFQMEFASRDPGFLAPVAPADLAGASNAWAAAPERSAKSSTLLANDPHLGLTAPTVWYLARLELEGGGVIGGTIPGMPVVMVGRSGQLGWGLTSSYLDDQDVHIEQLNPDNPEEYLTPGGYVPFETRQSILRVDDGDPVTLTLRWTENGPVLPGSHYDLGSVTPRGHVASVSWTLLSGADTTISAALEIMRADSVEAALAAGEGYIAPSQNLVLADADTVAMKTLGAMPKRAEAHQSQGRIPAPGWRDENRWKGRIAYDLNPEFLAPDGGIVGNTNNKTLDRDFPLHVSYDWGDTQRVRRWSRLMGSREVHTRESFIEAQLDTVSPSARTLLPLVGRDLFFTAEAAPEGTIERQRQIALGLLANWNGEMNEHLPEPLIYAAWMRKLQERLIRDELAGLASTFQKPEPLFIERVFRNVDDAGAWCDVLQSAPIETCTEVARDALDDALIWIEETWGKNLESLRWGDAHTARHDHPVLGNAPGLKWVVNIRQSTSGGDNTLMRGATNGSYPNPFLNVHGAGYRGVYDFADPDSSVFVTATGQSGHPLSRYYDDMGELWRRGEYVPMSLDPELARAAAVGVTVLTPAAP
ncbi:MAG: penicillin acylase family protein [Pseudomonadota bacterium]